MKKALVMIIAYNAERHIVSVLNRIPDTLWNNPDYQADVVVIDDCSKDHTSAVAREYISGSSRPIRLLRNQLNQGYGGNQKVGYTYAIENGYEAVVMVHGDGQYPPEFIPQMLEPLMRGEAAAVYGSRMINKKDALAGGMPYYKFAGNIVLTQLQNWMLGSNLSEFHSGFRAYSIAALRQIPFQYNSNVFHFDTDIIIQLVDNGLTIKEIPIPTHYGDEVCHVNGLRYAKDVMVSTLLSRIQKFGIFYDPKFDYERTVTYPDKSQFASSHSFALEQVNANETVLDLGCEAYVTGNLKTRGCKVIGCDWQVNDRMREAYEGVFAMDLNQPDFDVLGQQHFDVIMLLDVIEHISDPEAFMERLHRRFAAMNPRIVVTTPNIAFFIQRIMLLLGQFNYGKRGILNRKHTRLFTFASLSRLLSNSGFNVIKLEGIPAPFPLAFGDNGFARALLKFNQSLMKISRTLFSYQIAAVIQPKPTLEILVSQAIEYGDRTI
ncbi:MAG TPA: bifunctional glycosyltransferase/class I SAM-dependent methyltransferase [Rickettsiales bacterium]|nr:bifunctional glycosyltransferase/class I SAM-dependent methyltransferase [Rickettsiales bacterium]